MIKRFVKAIFGENDTPTRTLVVPSYDEATKAMARWAKSWKLKGIEKCLGAQAAHERIVNLFDSTDKTNLMMFVGHGRPMGLLTDPSIGKSNSPICTPQHGCLMDAEDITEGLQGMQIAAWACHAGSYFGPQIANLPGSGFLGFDGFLNMTINHKVSEQLWSGLIKELFERIGNRGTIEQNDAEWLRTKLLDLRHAIQDGRLNTGVHDLFNTSFLLAAAEGVAFYSFPR